VPIARFQTPDGRIARFEVPEGTTPEQAQAMAEKEFPNLVSKQEPSLVSRVGRQVGLTARAGIEGLAAIPAMIADVPAAVYNKVADATQPQTLSSLITGDSGFRFPGQRQALSNLLTRLGFPEAETPVERVSQDVAGAMAAQGGIAKVGNMMVKTAGPVVQKVGSLLSSVPRSQIVAAGAGAGGSSVAREAGAGPGVQLVAGLGAGVGAPIAVDTTIAGLSMLGRGGKSFIEQFTQGGRERATGAVLRRMATDPERAITNMEGATEIIPGSQPTTAQAARDPGLLTLERGLQSTNQRAGSELTRRASQQNTARNAVLNELAKDADELAFAKANRAGTAEELYKQAYEIGIDTSKMTPARRGEITKLLQRPAIQSAIKEAKTLAKNEGVKMSDPAGSVQGLDYVKRALDDQIGRTQGNEQRILVALKNRLLTTIDTLSPEYSSARKVFADMSKPVNQMEALQGVRERVLNAGTDAVTGERLLSAAKFSNVLNKSESRQELMKVLTPEQFGNLERISADLERGALSMSAGKAVGSNTMQNLSVAHVIGSAVGGKLAQNPVMRTLSAPLKWLSDISGNEAALQDLLTDAMLDPVLAKSLMRKATPSAVESVAFELRQRAIARGIGGAAGTAASVGRQQPTEQATAQ